MTGYPFIYPTPNQFTATAVSASLGTENRLTTLYSFVQPAIPVPTGGLSALSALSAHYFARAGDHQKGSVYSGN